MVNELKDRQPRLVIKGNRIQYGGEELANLTADATADPKGIDLKFRDADSVLEGVYTADRDSFKICLNKRIEGVKERPTSFVTKDREDLRLLVFPRETESEAGADGLTGYIGVMLAIDAEKKAVVITGTMDASPAKKAGVKMDDVLVAVDNGPVAELQSAVKAVRGIKPGSELTLRIRRAEKEIDIKVKVGVLPFKFLAGLD